MGKSLMLNYLAVFFVVALTDILWAKYFLAVSQSRMVVAPLVSSGIIVFGSFATISYVNDHWALIPAALGAYAGTYITMWLEKKKK